MGRFFWLALALFSALRLSPAAAGEIQFYSSAPRTISDALISRFTGKNPDVKVTLFQAGNEVVLEKIEREIKSTGRPAADVLWIQEPSTLQRFAKSGVLEKYSPPNAANIRESFKDPDGYYTGTAVTFMVLMYNSRLVTRGDAPTSWSSLTEGRYRNQLIFADPRVSGTGAAVASALLQTYGWKYWEAISRNRPILAAGHPGVLSTVISGKRSVSPMQDLAIVEATKKGEPIAFVIPAEGAVTVGCYAAIVKATKNLPDSKRFVDFMASDEAAAVLASNGMYHTSSKARPPAGWPQMDDIKPLPFDWAKHEVTKNELKEKFVKLIDK